MLEAQAALLENRDDAVKREIPDARYPALDGVRGLAVLAVWGYHLFNYSIHPLSPVSTQFQRLVSTGWIGVDLFFVLSGFLITGNLLRHSKALNYYKIFYAHRVLRIFPLYYTVLLGTLVIMHGHFPFRQQVWYWLNLSNLVTAFVPMLIVSLSHFWSLAVEEQFYMVWPTMVRRVEPRTIGRFCVAIIVGLFAIRNLPVALTVNLHYPEVLYRLTPFRVDGLCAGALAAIVMKFRPALFQHRWKLRAVFIVAAAIFMIVGYGHAPSYVPVVRFGYTSLVIGFTALLALATSNVHLTGRICSNAFLRLMGKYSYCLYLIHPMLMLFVNGHPIFYNKMAAALHAQDYSNTAQVILALIQFGVEIAICALSFKYFESPFLKMKKRFRYQDKLVSAAAN